MRLPDTRFSGKRVYSIPSKSIINFNSGFKHKLLCDGLTFSTGTACVFKCAFCYVGPMMARNPQTRFLKCEEIDHSDVVIRRRDPLTILKSQLLDRRGRPKFLRKENDQRVIYASPLVDVAANMELVRETVEVCEKILELTHWQIRLLSKSNLLLKVAEKLPSVFRDRVIYGFSTGTIDDRLARSFEEGTALVRKRLKALHALQDNGYRTFGMICPSLPQNDYRAFAKEMAYAIRPEKCEHVWAEIINVRGESMNRTCDALLKGGFAEEAEMLRSVSSDRSHWEDYARRTFLAHSEFIPARKLRFLQYVTTKNLDWWRRHESEKAVLLGKVAQQRD